MDQIPSKKINIKAGSIKELEDSLVQAFDQSNAENKEIFKIILEEVCKLEYRLGLILSSLFLKLEEDHGIKIDLIQINKEARGTTEKDWPEKRKEFLQRINLIDIDIYRQVNDIFNKKDKGSPT